MSTFWSTDTQSTPVAPMRSSMPPLPDAYRMSGRRGCVRFTSATMRVMYGPLKTSQSQGDRLQPQLSKICTTCAPQSAW